VEAAPDIDVPDALLPDDRLHQLLAERQPAYVPLPGAATVRGRVMLSWLWCSGFACRQSCLLHGTQRWCQPSCTLPRPDLGR